MKKRYAKQRCCLVLAAKLETTADREADVVGAFLLQPDVPRVVVGELDDQGPQVFGERCRNLLDELLLAGYVDGRKELVFMQRQQQLLVLVLALLFRVGERGH